jgi:hypothetical protein
MIGRDNEIAELREHIKHKHSVLITGRKGVGKTTFLKFVAEKTGGCYVEFASTKPILEAVINHLGLITEKNIRYCTIQELLDLIRPSLKKPVVLVLDEGDSISKYCGKMLDKLSEENIVIIAASEKKVWNFRFRKEIQLYPLNRKQAKELSGEYLGPRATPLLLDLVATKSLGFPGKIKEICDDINTFHKNLELDTHSENSVFKFFKDIKPQFPDRINILPLWFLFVIGFGLLLLRYYFYQWGDFQEGYLVAMFGYTSLILYRLVTMKKEEK